MMSGMESETRNSSRCLTSRETELIAAHKAGFSPREERTASAKDGTERPSTTAGLLRLNLADGSMASKAPASSVAASGHKAGSSQRSSTPDLGRVLGPGAAKPHHMEHIWHSCIQLIDAPQEPAPPVVTEPEVQPVTPHTSDVGEELSDEEDDHLAALLTGLPSVDEPGTQTGERLTSEGLPAGLSGAAGSHTTPAVSATLLRLAKLNKCMKATSNSGSVVDAMFAAARTAAGSVDVHASLRDSIGATPDQVRPEGERASNSGSCAKPLTTLLPWNITRAQHEASLQRALDKLQSSSEAEKHSGRGHGKRSSGSLKKALQEEGKQTRTSRNGGILAALASTPATDVDPAQSAGRAQTESVPDPVYGQRMIPDTGSHTPSVEASFKSNQDQAGVMSPSANGTEPAAKGPGFGFGSKVPGQSSPVSMPSKPVSARKTSSHASKPATPVVQTQEAKPIDSLGQKVDLAEAKHQAVQSTLLSISPLRAKTARPISALANNSSSLFALQNMKGTLANMSEPCSPSKAAPSGGDRTAMSTPNSPLRLTERPSLKQHERFSTVPETATPTEDRHTAPNSPSVYPMSPYGKPSPVKSVAGPSPGLRHVPMSDSQLLRNFYERPSPAASATASQLEVELAGALSGASETQAMNMGLSQANRETRNGNPVVVAPEQSRTLDKSLSASKAAASVLASVLAQEQMPGMDNCPSPVAEQRAGQPGTLGSCAVVPSPPSSPLRTTRNSLQLMKASRAAREADMMIAEEAKTRTSCPTDRAGEAARLMRRYAAQSEQAPTSHAQVFNLAHSIRSIDQIVALAGLLPKLPYVTALILAGNDLSDDSAAILAHALSDVACNSIDALDLSANKLSIRSLKALCPLMQELHSLSPASSPAAKKQTTKSNSAAMPLPQAMVRQPTLRGAALTEILLGGNQLLGDAAAELLAALLAQPSCSLRVLDLGKCGITERGASSLGTGLTHCRSLEVLDLSWNALGVRGTAAIAAALRGTCSVQQLYIQWTGAGDQGASHIVQALVNNNSLKVLDLSGNAVSSGTCMVLQEALKVNTTLTTLILRDNPLGQMGTRRLLEAVHHMGKGQLRNLDLMGCTFQGTPGLVGDMPADMQLPSFNPNQPDGQYQLDLALPSHLQIAWELLDLASTQGAKTWTNATINCKPFKLCGTSRVQLPEKGVLSVTFVSKAPLAIQDRPMTEQEFAFVWLSQVYKTKDSGGHTNVTHNPYASTSRDVELYQKARLQSTPAVASPIHGADLYNDLDKLLPSASTLDRPSPSRFSAPGGKSTNAGLASPNSFQQPQPPTSPSTAPYSPLLKQIASPKLPKSPLRTVTASSSCPGAVGSPATPSHVHQPSRLQNEDMSAAKSYVCAPNSPYSGLRPTSSIVLPDNSSQTLDSEASKLCSEVSITSTATQQGSVVSRPATAASSGSVLMQERGLRSTGAAAGQSLAQIKGATDSWKLNLLSAITSESYLQCSQLVQVMDAIHEPSLKTLAAVQSFAKLTDPDNLHLVCDALGPAGAGELMERVGDLQYFHPANPTGSWQLLLSHPVHSSLARRLLVAASQQHDMGLTRWPFHTCLVQCSIDNKPLDTESPHHVKLLKEGMLKVNFVDLRPVPVSAKPLSNQQLSALISIITHEDKLDPRKVVTSLDAAGLNTLVNVLSKWGAVVGGKGSVAAGGVAVGLSSHVASLRAAAVRQGTEPLAVKDLAGLLPTMRRIAINHYVTCEQLSELLVLLPYHSNLERVELCSIFWARTVDRATGWTNIMRQLSDAQQVLLTQRLGVFNVFNCKRPSLHYRLRMFRPDEHEMAWQLFNMSLDAPIECFTNFSIDGNPKKINEGASIWPVLKGSAKDGTVPSCTIEFDFTWPEPGKGENKIIEALQARLAAAKASIKEHKEVTTKRKPADESTSAKLVSLPLRKVPAVDKKPDKDPQARPGTSSGGPRLGLRDTQTQAEKDMAEGVMLRDDGKLRRAAPQGAMKFFTRIVSGQAQQVAAPALYMDSSIQEEIGLFGYNVSYAGGLLLDKATRRKLKAPISNIAAGQVPGGLAEGLPWAPVQSATDQQPPQLTKKPSGPGTAESDTRAVKVQATMVLRPEGQDSPRKPLIQQKCDEKCDNPRDTPGRLQTEPAAVPQCDASNVQEAKSSASSAGSKLGGFGWGRLRARRDDLQTLAENSEPIGQQ